MKNAFLILAHNEFTILRLLVSKLDDPRNDIFIHFDKKVESVPHLSTQFAGLTVLDTRVDVRWGAPSMVEAEYSLFSKAIADGPYQYYHLLSGVDLPIKSQEYIHSFLDRNEGKEFIGYTWVDMPEEFRRKVQCWHLFPEDFKNRNLIKKVLRAGFIRIQELLRVYRNSSIPFKKGSQWVSVTDGMARYFVDNIEWIRKIFRNTFCCDELVMQTLCWMSPFKKNIFSLASDGEGCMRLIGWRQSQNGGEWTLKDWAKEDFGLLSSSDALFARKFNSKDMEFIKRVSALSE